MLVVEGRLQAPVTTPLTTPCRDHSQHGTWWRSHCHAFLPCVLPLPPVPALLALPSVIADAGSADFFQDFPVINRCMTASPLAMQNPNGSIMRSTHDREIESQTCLQLLAPSTLCLTSSPIPCHPLANFVMLAGSLNLLLLMPLSATTTLLCSKAITCPTPDCGMSRFPTSHPLTVEANKPAALSTNAWSPSLSAWGSNNHKLMHVSSAKARRCVFSAARMTQS